MHNYLKYLAVLTALVLALSVFCACGQKVGDINYDDDSSKSETDNTDADNSSDDQIDVENTVEHGLFIDGKKIENADEIVMLTVNGVEVPFDEYRYMYLAVNNYYSFADGYWEENPSLFPSFLEVIDYNILDSIWGKILAKEHGIVMTDEDNAKLDGLIEDQINAFSSHETYEQALKDAGITEELLRRVIGQSVLNERVYLDLFGGENPKLLGTDEEIKEDMKNNYVRVYHVLISNDHYKGEEGYAEYTDEMLAEEAKGYAQQLLEKIQKGEADVYELAQTVGDDPSMVDNEEGYFFTYGRMVEPFEKASFELKPGELSGLVETDYGWHIIYRLEQDEYIEENFDTLKTDLYISDKFNTYVDNLISEAQIEYGEYYDKLTYDSIR